MILNYKIIEEKSEWDWALNKFKYKDIHLDYNYFFLYKTEENKPIMLYMETDKGKIIYPFMLRDIATDPGLKNKIEKGKYFDISTPYGFGGPLIDSDDSETRKYILKLLNRELSKFCIEHNVVSEFIRFIPIIKNYKDMEKVIEVDYVKVVPTTNLKEYGKTREMGLSQSRRHSVKKARSRGMEVIFEFSPKSFDKQLQIYYDTMDRKKATEAFKFSEEYFKNMLELLSDKLLCINVMFQGEIISFGLCFISQDTIYGFVAGTNREYMKYSPSTINYVETMNWAADNGYTYFFLGGGKTSAKDDSLYLYKKSFSNTEFNFYIGKKIWNKENYDYLLNLCDKEVEKDENFFPKYRQF